MSGFMPIIRQVDIAVNQMVAQFLYEFRGGWMETAFLAAVGLIGLVLLSRMVDERFGMTGVALMMAAVTAVMFYYCYNQFF